IMEPIVQGAGGMWFYHPQYLREVRKLCDEYGVLLILDEIATGFGRSGKMFASEHASISPDIMCVGKALTGGYMSLAATLASQNIAEIISDRGNGAFMHGPTFMANPLACAVSLANINLLLSWAWKDKVRSMAEQMRVELEPCRGLAQVTDVRVLGGIGVVELEAAVDSAEISARFVDRGVWVRPFGRLIYIMPPYIIDEADLGQLTRAIYAVVSEIG
ncbi:MAG: aminotransferase class III-fold pyridoxal phosphate-dependent enzyme, partial [Gammaproteobacteria bacterium]